MSREFADGMAMTAAETSARPGFLCCQYGLINAEGRVVVEPRYPEARDFSEGLAAVAMGDRWGYIDKKGRVRIKPQFYMASGFSGGIAMVMLADRRMGYIDKTGKYVWRPTN